MDEPAATRESPGSAGEDLTGDNLGGSNLGGANLGGCNLGGSNLGGANLGGTNLGGANLGGANLGGANLGGANLGGSNLGGSNLGGVNLGGSNLGGANLGGTNLGGANLGGTNLGGTDISAANAGVNIHGLSSAKGMLASGEDLSTPRTSASVMMGIGSTAFAKLVKANNVGSNPSMNVLIGKLPWGFASTSGGSIQLDAWEAVIWGSQQYSVFVLGAPPAPAVTFDGVAGFVKAIFRWNAPPTMTVHIGPIGGTVTQPTCNGGACLVTYPVSYPGMMNAAASVTAGTIPEANYVAGAFAFASATTNNQIVNVDFASWVHKSSSSNDVPALLGNVSGAPRYYEGMWLATLLSDGSVQISFADLNGPTMVHAYSYGVITSLDSLSTVYGDWLNHNSTNGLIDHSGSPAKPVSRRCAGAIRLYQDYGEPIPTGKCDSYINPNDPTFQKPYTNWSSFDSNPLPYNHYMEIPFGASTGTPLAGTAVHLNEVGFDVPSTDWIAVNANGHNIVSKTNHYVHTGRATPNVNDYFSVYDSNGTMVGTKMYTSSCASTPGTTAVPRQTCQYIDPQHLSSTGKFYFKLISGSTGLPVGNSSHVFLGSCLGTGNSTKCY